MEYTENPGDIKQDLTEALEDGEQLFLTTDPRLKKAAELISSL